MGTIKFANIGHIVDVAAFGGIHSIRYDLESAARIAEYLLRVSSGEFPGVEIMDGLSTALVVRYSRAFASGVRHSPHVRSALAELTEEQRGVHHAIVTMRDKHIAHSVNAQEESWVGAQYYEERVADEGFVGVAVQHGRTVGFGEDELQSILNVTKALLTYLDTRIKEEEARLLPSPESLSAEEILRDPRSEVTWDADRTPPHKRRKNP
ncbi:MAG TPA: hypothetical protein VGQ65_00730 [Thermoanaerobaculia bacterium]|jgi:hypothetical protein|nr:hypothetical protein [Thermoanaerobaculia bacterium]